MDDPSLAIQGALVAALKADAGVAALVGDRVYDSVPSGPTFPYVTLGDAQVLPEKYDCVDGAESFATIDVWSRAVGYPEAKRIVSAIMVALDEQPLTLSGAFVDLELQLDQINYLRDPDGITRHAAISFRLLIDSTNGGGGGGGGGGGSPTYYILGF